MLMDTVVTDMTKMVTVAMVTMLKVGIRISTRTLLEDTMCMGWIWTA